MAYNKFLELVSKVIWSDPAVVDFASRQQAGWKDLLISLLLDVTKVTISEEENYVRLTEKAFSWLSPSEPKKQKQREDKKLGKARKPLETSHNHTTILSCKLAIKS
jgi:hypothetical protein